MDDRRNKFIVGGLIGLIVLAIVVLVFLKSGPKCDLIDTKPVSDLTKLKNLASSDYKSLLNFAGYLKYNIDSKDDKKKEFLPLNVQSINTEDVKDSTDRLFVLNGDCAKMTLTVRTDKTTKKESVSNINVDLTTANGDSKSCTIVNPMNIEAAAGKHYSCMIDKTYTCKDKDKIVAELVLNDLEFELNGNSDKIKAGEFSTEKESCKAN